MEPGPAQHAGTTAGTTGGNAFEELKSTDEAEGSGDVVSKTRLKKERNEQIRA